MQPVGEWEKAFPRLYAAFRSKLLQALNLYIPKCHWVIVSSNTEISACPIFPRMRAVAHVLRHRAYVSVNDDRAVQFDLDFGTLDRHFLEVPFPDRPQESAMRRHDAINGTVELPRVELR